jgi:hypothetical protein
MGEPLHGGGPLLGADHTATTKPKDRSHHLEVGDVEGDVRTIAAILVHPRAVNDVHDSSRDAIAVCAGHQAVAAVRSHETGPALDNQIPRIISLVDFAALEFIQDPEAVAELAKVDTGNADDAPPWLLHSCSHERQCGQPA